MSNIDKKLLVVGNWKMNKSLKEAVSLAHDLKAILHDAPELLMKAELSVCPSFLHLSDVSKELDSVPILVGAQDCADNENGAHTGEISAEMISDVGAVHVILGHSERRQNQGETSEQVAQKVQKAQAQGLITLVCVGETLKEREAGEAYEIVESQLEKSIPENVESNKLVIAYEPVWAIGTGKVASEEDVRAMHEVIALFMKEKLDKTISIRILYGGSVKPDNAGNLSRIQHVDGFLVGGASLNAESFIGIAHAIEGQ